jgi:hypothetical protein
LGLNLIKAYASFFDRRRNFVITRDQSGNEDCGTPLEFFTEKQGLAGAVEFEPSPPGFGDLAGHQRVGVE